MNEIGERAFRGCGLSTITINDVYRIHPQAFEWTQLSSFTWNNTHTLYIYNTSTKTFTTKTFGDQDITLSQHPFSPRLSSITSCTINTTANAQICVGMTNLTTAYIGEKTTLFYYGTFNGCSKLSSLTGYGWSQIRSVGTKAFQGCTSYQANVVMNATTAGESYQIDEKAFAGSGIKSITIGSSDKDNYYLTIGANAFANCTSLSSVNIYTRLYSYVDALAPSAFNGCTGVKTLRWENSTGWYLSSEPYSWSGYGPFSRCTNLEEIYISRGSGRGQIFDFEFAGLTNLKKVTIGEGISDVGANSFYGCTGITTVEWDVQYDYNSYTRREESPFGSTSKISSVTFGSKVTVIPSYLFAGQTNLTSIRIPASVTKIGAAAFRWCPFTTLTLYSGIEWIGSEAFYGCKLTSVTIPETLKLIGEQAFVPQESAGPLSVKWNARRCTFSKSDKMDGFGVFRPGSSNQSISSIVFGSEVETLPAKLCYNALLLNSVSLPASVREIGDSAFMSCSNVRVIECMALTPPTLGEKVFEGINRDDPDGLKGVIVTVPENSLPLYKAAEGWKDFWGCVVEYELPDVDEWRMTGRGRIEWSEPEEECSPLRTATAVEEAGYTFLRWSDGETENPRVIDLSDFAPTGLFYAVFVSEGDYTQLEVTVDPVGGAEIEFTNGDGEERLDGRYLLDFGDYAAVILPVLHEGYEFGRWEYDDVWGEVTEDAETHELTVQLNRGEEMTMMGPEWVLHFPLEYTLHLDDTTGLEEVMQSAAEANVRKVMIDGALYILKDGKMYDVLGAEVR